jgi:NodT family efflux transporter outer membrane factor (OMF) lipoprotein
VSRPYTLIITLAVTCGCTSVPQYIRNGCKVGPNFGRPPAPVASDWIDAADVRIRTDSDDPTQWWTVFNDPVLNSLICDAYQQNLTLRQAGMRVLQARAQQRIAVGEFFPQTQKAFGAYTRNAESREVANRNVSTQFFDQWDLGFHLAWELDLWGRFRRAIEAANANLEASVEDYDDVLVTLLGDVAANYVRLRTLEQQLVYSRANVVLQRETLEIVEARFNAGTTTKLDVVQARSTLEQTEALIPELLMRLRRTNNQLCTLLGIPPEELSAKLGVGVIPIAPVDVAVGIPAELLRRRPDVRRAERQVAAQSAQIGIAESDLYPHISIIGTIGYSAEHLNDLFQPSALEGFVGPSFQWKILNYGRIVNNVRFQDARLREFVAAYQAQVLTAGQEVEDGLVTFLRAQQRTEFQAASVSDAEEAIKYAVDQYRAGTIDFTRVAQLQENLVLFQDTLAQARGEIALGLIEVYRALGGGWQIRCTGCEPGTILSQDNLPTDGETLPPPRKLPPVNQPDMSPTPSN